jgi:hypothetical protein
MEDDVLRERGRSYRLRAEEARTAADNMRNPQSRALLGRIAADYDLLADLMERRTARASGRSDLIQGTTNSAGAT